MPVEIACLALGGAALMALLSRYEVFEELYEFSRAHEDWELDEVFIAIPVLTLLLGLFAVNRLLQLRREIATRQKLELKLLDEVTTNRLTGLPNEQIFFSQIDSALISAGAFARGSIAVIRTNARFALKGASSSHHLTAIMAELVARCRSAVPAGTLLASMDNDTLMLFVPDDIRASQRLLDRLAALLAVPVSTGEGQVELSVRIGAAIIKGRSKAGAPWPAREDLHQALASALHVLEKTPALNRITVAFHDAAMEQREHDRKTLAARVEAILDADAFDCAFQPIITLANGATTGFGTAGALAARPWRSRLARHIRATD
ncbi:MAG: hypothetical protein HC779_05710 [Phyllobacteriaceae bacterium]|nr:hypothetical protein [Phyllobacteriaceae bacterium]